MKFASKSRKQQNALWVWPTVSTFSLPRITDIFLHCCCPALPSSPHFSSTLSSFLLCLPGNKSYSCSECDQPLLCSHISSPGSLPSCQAHAINLKRTFFLWKKGQKGLGIPPVPAPASMCSPAGSSASSSSDPTRIHGTGVRAAAGRELTFFCKDERGNCCSCFALSLQQTSLEKKKKNPPPCCWDNKYFSFHPPGLRTFGSGWRS